MYMDWMVKFDEKRDFKPLRLIINYNNNYDNVLSEEQIL